MDTQTMTEILTERVGRNDGVKLARLSEFIDGLKLKPSSLIFFGTAMREIGRELQREIIR